MRICRAPWLRISHATRGVKIPKKLAPFQLAPMPPESFIVSVRGHGMLSFASCDCVKVRPRSIPPHAAA